MLPFEEVIEEEDKKEDKSEEEKDKEPEVKRYLRCNSCGLKKDLSDDVKEEYSVDKSRIYLCGLSMGGFGTWYTATAYPDLFAAIAPCCGGGMPWNAKLLKMPIWTFHGLDDDIVSPRNTIEMIDALKDINPNFKYNLYEGVEHNSWDLAFVEELIEWFLSHKKPE